MTTTLNDTTFLAVHALAVKKAAEGEDVASVAGLPTDVVVSALETVAQRGHVLAARGKYMVTPQGRTWLDEQYPVVFAAQRADTLLAECYEAFEVINSQLLALMTRWQTVSVGGSTVPNDHTDEAYDAAIIDELGAFHERAVPVLTPFTGPMPRLGHYLTALEEAQARILAGETDFVSGARVQSYHTVWFELHEDLLRILGRSRKSE